MNDEWMSKWAIAQPWLRPWVGEKGGFHVLDKVFKFFWSLCNFLLIFKHLVLWFPIFVIVRCSAPYFQTGTPQLQSGKYIPLSHEVESTFKLKFCNGRLHFKKICYTKRKAHSGKNSEAECRSYEAESTFCSEFHTVMPHVLRIFCFTNPQHFAP